MYIQWKSGRFFQAVFALMVTCSAIMTYLFYSQIPSSISSGRLLGLFMVLCTIAAPFLVSAAVKLWKAGDRRMVYAIGISAFLAVFGDFVGNYGFVASEKAVANKEASLQTVRYSDQRETVVDNKKEIQFWEQRIVDLGWAANTTVTAEAIKAQEENIRQERNDGGCGPKCKLKMVGLAKMKGDLEAKQEHTKAVNMLEASRRVLKKEREKSAATDTGLSVGNVQSGVVASNVTFSMAPTEYTKFAIGAILSLILGLAVCLVPSAFGTLVFDIFFENASGLRNRANPSTSVRNEPQPSATLRTEGPDPMTQAFAARFASPNATPAQTPVQINQPPQPAVHIHQDSPRWNAGVDALVAKANRVLGQAHAA